MQIHVFVFGLQGVRQVILAMLLAGILIASANGQVETESRSGVELIVLGVAQDAGYPQAGCRKPCCQRAWENSEAKRFPTCLAIVDHDSHQRWLLECTPQFTDQLNLLDQLCPNDDASLGVDGILLTHAHIGHYAGLMFLGREVIGAQHVPVYAMPRMMDFLTTQGPWRQLVTLGNIELQPIREELEFQLNERIRVTAILVPHRDEYSETVAFRVSGPEKSFLFLPDIDKWERWDRAIEDEIAKVDYAFLDATFYDGDELPGRDMSEIPHPFVVETLDRLRDLDSASKAKVHLIHFNHTNPLLNAESEAAADVTAHGFNVAQQGMRIRF
ncbi:MAG: MBL fold metallo-hydrolase [Pirellulaceae bacterium]